MPGTETRIQTSLLGECESIFVRMCVRVPVYPCVCMHLCSRVSVCAHVCSCVCMHLSAHLCVCAHVCAHVCAQWNGLGRIRWCIQKFITFTN